MNGEKPGPVELLTRLNEMGSRRSRYHIVENRLVGMKSRGVYETPGGTILFAARKDWKRTYPRQRHKPVQDRIWQSLPDWFITDFGFTPLREAISAFVDVTQENIAGTVKMALRAMLL